MNSINNFVNNWKEFNNARVGLEFEFFSNYDYVKTLEILNNTFNPIEVYGFNSYHSNFTVSNTQFKIEPDFSGGSNMIELITGPMEYTESKIIIGKMLQFIKEHGYTNESCSIHINISFKDIEVRNLKPVKLILDLNEDYIYSKFPDRKNNIYARSIKYIVPFENFINVEYGMNAIINSFTIPNDSKYYGVNFQKMNDNYLEFRYIGGENYENKKIEIFNILDYFLKITRTSIEEEYMQDDYIKLSSFLDDNISWYRSFTTYEDFLMNNDFITIEVNKNDNYNYIVNYWDQFKDSIFKLVKYSDEITKCKINYNTLSKRIEVIEAGIDGLILVKNIDFIECRIKNSNINYSDLIECIAEDSHIYNTNIYDSKINSSKLENTKCTDYTELNECVFDGGILDCIMDGGIFRSGEITENADISNNVKMSNSSDFWMISDITNKKNKK